ncbi:MlaD family protein [Pseudonocardia sp. H11422]|uniref:MlaD family protein n=1 Tax=Pseudonocardia sp. H11422 TaxID=2835866 RepID=UPI001BDD9F41|nr:MlaD family protein [Pseudonocardia sp. H11422]
MTDTPSAPHTRVDGWRRTWQRVRTVPGLARDVTALVALLVLGAAVGGYILSQQRANWPWQQEFHFTAEFDAVPAISPGNGQEVRIAGVPVGDIRDAEVTEAGSALLHLSIDGDEPTVYDNAKLVLRPKSPLNEMYVEIDPGGPPGAPITEGQVIPKAQSRYPIQVDAVLTHLDDRSRDALTSLLATADTALANAPAHLPDGLRATDDTLTGLAPVAEALSTRRERIATLVASLGRIMEATGEKDVRLAQLADSMQQTLGVLADRDDELAATLEELPGVTGELRRATSATQDLTEQLDPTLDNVARASEELPEALSALRGTVGQVDETLDVAQPVVDRAGPVVADLRPLVVDVHGALQDLEPTTTRLEPITAGFLPYLTDLQAFVYNTNSAFSLSDANGGLFRGLTGVTPETASFLKLPSIVQEPPR